MALLSNILTVQWIVAQYWQFLVRQPKSTAWASSSLFMRHQAERVSVLIKRFWMCSRWNPGNGWRGAVAALQVWVPAGGLFMNFQPPSATNWSKLPHFLISWNLSYCKTANVIWPEKTVKLGVPVNGVVAECDRGAKRMCSDCKLKNILGYKSKMKKRSKFKYLKYQIYDCSLIYFSTFAWILLFLEHTTYT